MKIDLSNYEIYIIDYLDGKLSEQDKIYAGVPAKKVKSVSPEQFKDLVERIANNYVMYAGWFK